MRSKLEIKKKKKARTTWNLINREACKKVMKENIQTLNSEGKNDTNLYTLVEVFNKYFSGAADTIHKQIKENCKNVKTKSINYMTYMSMAFGSTFPNINYKLHGLSPRANYTDQATAACRRSDCQLVRIEGATWSA
jgi:hypothetical protein